MPKVVDVDKKREDIAKKCVDLVLEKGFANITVSQVASHAKVAKGSIYNYFNSKEDIIYEIIKSEYSDYDKEVEEEIAKASTIKEKVLALFKLCLSDEKKDKERRKLYREFVSVCLNQSECDMVDFKKSIKIKYIQWLKKILKSGEEKGVLKKDSERFSQGLFVMAEGVILLSDYNKEILTSFIDELFKYIEINKEEILKKV
jgi:AcrR family transcriptional regulator